MSIFSSIIRNLLYSSKMFTRNMQITLSGDISHIELTVHLVNSNIFGNTVDGLAHIWFSGCHDVSTYAMVISSRSSSRFQRQVPNLTFASGLTYSWETGSKRCNIHYMRLLLWEELIIVELCSILSTVTNITETCITGTRQGKHILYGNLRLTSQIPKFHVGTLRLRPF